MNDIESALRIELRDREYAEEYASSFLNAYIATQIKVIREQRGMTQAALAESIGTTQTGISRIEDVNYSSWSIRSLSRIARALSTRLKVSFETYGTLPSEVVRFQRSTLERLAREDDPELQQNAYAESPLQTKALQPSYNGNEARLELARKPVVNVGNYRQQAARSGFEGLLSGGQEEGGGLNSACS